MHYFLSVLFVMNFSLTIDDVIDEVSTDFVTLIALLILCIVYNVV